MVVSLVEFPQFLSEMRQGDKVLLAYELPVEDLVVAFDLAAASWVVGSSVYESYAFFFGLGLEFLGYELFAVVQINLFRLAAFAQSPNKRVYRLVFALAKISLGHYPIP